MSDEEVIVLKLMLHERVVGYLAGFQHGRNVLTFASEFVHDPKRPTFSLVTHPNFPHASDVMSTQWVKTQRLHPILSNLLPEEVLRELIAQRLKVHVNNEFQLLAYLGTDFPGALVAEAMAPENVPEQVISGRDVIKLAKFQGQGQANKFSLAGIQMKFSMKQKDGRYNISKTGELGDWIIKTPSTKHPYVPLNEYTAMRLAEMAGISIPEIKLIEVNKLDNLPSINLPNEKFAFAIKRFDRVENTRVHMEDFAQVFVKYPEQKYRMANYEQIGRVLYTYSGDGLADVQQFARRLLVNILLANGDAHIKNWSLLYPDQVTPRLSPAYDIVTTSVYMDDEQEFALNLAQHKNWYTVNFSHFERWANKAGIPWRAVKPHLDDTMERVRSSWLSALQELPMDELQKKQLQAHWGRLHGDFRIG